MQPGRHIRGGQGLDIVAVFGVPDFMPDQQVILVSRDVGPQWQCQYPSLKVERRRGRVSVADRDVFTGQQLSQTALGHVDMGGPTGAVGRGSALAHHVLIIQVLGSEVKSNVAVSC